MADKDLLPLLMRSYAQSGFSDWRSGTKEREQSEAIRDLGGHIVESDEEVNFAISRRPQQKFFGARQKKFIPMLKIGYKRDIEHSFFLPRFYGNSGDSPWAFILFLILSKEYNLAFRFESPNRDDSRHDYAHMQFCRSPLIENIYLRGIPCWIPDREPAFLLPSSGPLAGFLAMLIAVHGGSSAVECVIRTALQQANRAAEIEKYICELKKII